MTRHQKSTNDSDECLVIICGGAGNNNYSSSDNTGIRSADGTKSTLAKVVPVIGGDDDEIRFAIDTGAGYAIKQVVLATFRGKNQLKKHAKTSKQTILQRAKALTNHRLPAPCPLVRRLRSRVEVRQLAGLQVERLNITGVPK